MQYEKIDLAFTDSAAIREPPALTALLLGLLTLIHPRRAAESR